ncbi:kinesin-8, putative [Plasmodium ovale wallikeri]|uniref:Kinesin-like protein KIN-8B n=1 Tax=Plasmodium ovale wallikeri TaxID=864142 RepID=A0A1A8YI44_PLAOA|nr:kinesin-8, putative [Plasmodium ovale wallikeri]
MGYMTPSCQTIKWSCVKEELMESENNKRHDSHEDSEWTGKGVSSIVSNFTNLHTIPGYQAEEGVSTSNRTADNSQGTTYNRDDAAYGDAADDDAAYDNAADQDDLGGEFCPSSGMSTNAGDRSACTAEKVNVGDAKDNSYSRNTQKSTKHGEDGERLVKICINDVRGEDDNICGDTLCSGSGSPGDIYDEKRLYPMYRHKGEYASDQTEENKDQPHCTSVEELMKEINIFNDSMQSISSTDDLSFHTNLSKIYSEIASNRSLEVTRSMRMELEQGEITNVVGEKVDQRKEEDLSQNEPLHYWTVDQEEESKAKFDGNEVSPLNLQGNETTVISPNQWEEMKKSFCDIEYNLMGINKTKQHRCDKTGKGDEGGEGEAVREEARETTREEAREAIRETTREASSEAVIVGGEASNVADRTDAACADDEVFPVLDYAVIRETHTRLPRRSQDKTELERGDPSSENCFAKCPSPMATYAGVTSPMATYSGVTSPSATYSGVTSPSATYAGVSSPRANYTVVPSSCGNPPNCSDDHRGEESDRGVHGSPSLFPRKNACPSSPILNFAKGEIAKVRSPRNVGRGCSGKAVTIVSKFAKAKSKVGETTKTPKMGKRNSDGGRGSISMGEGKGTFPPAAPAFASTASTASMAAGAAAIAAASGASGTSGTSGASGALGSPGSPPSGRAHKGASSEKDLTYNMNVVIRCRPMSVSEKNDGAKNVIKIMDNKMVVLLDPANNSDNVLRQNRSREKKYVFDYVFDENSTQEDVYNYSVKCLIDGVIKGYNSTVFAYGATGAGKTHTVIGYKNEPGIMMMILRDLFEKIKSLEVMNVYKVKCSFVEIYNENICDLLNPSNDYLDLREDPIKGVTVSNIFEVCTTSVEEIMELIHTGNRNRTQEPTDANKTSSRSHGVLQVIVEETEKGQGIYQQTKRGKLCVIDLAGSERASQTNNKGMRMLEGANINRSLLALGNVINALVLRSKGTSKSNFIPFRDSKLTRLLKDSLGGNCKTLMIANISPSHLSYEDTHNTLKYANRAKNIKNVVTSNAIVVKHHLTMYIDVIEKLKSEIEFLKEQLNEKERSHEYMSTSSSNYDYYDTVREYEKNCSREELINIITSLKRENQRLKQTDGGDANVHHALDTDADITHTEEHREQREELANLRAINEKLFADNKSFQAKVKEYAQVSEGLKALNEEYKKQIDGFKVMIYNNDINHIQIKKKLDDLKKKYAQLKESTEDKDNDGTLEKWKNELTRLLKERKKIKMIILDIERNLIENKELSTKKFAESDVKMLQENKVKLNEQLKVNIAQTNHLIKELPLKIKDEKTKNFLYLFYTNKVLLQEKEELQDFFELSSILISQKEKQIEHLKGQLKMADSLANRK